MKACFYDIESLTNVFSLANFRQHDNTVEIYYLVDDPCLITPSFEDDLRQMVYKANDNFTGPIELYDLRKSFDATKRLAVTFGLSDASQINNPSAKSSYDSSYRLVCDTDTNYNEDDYPYLFGYNSYNYDTTMLTWYLYNSIDEKTGAWHPQTAASMRNFNDELFAPQFKDCMPDRLKYSYKDPYRPALGYGASNYRNPLNIIRKNMIMSGRHVDVAKINEKQVKVGLKRLLGMKGLQILESNKLRSDQATIYNTEQLLDLLAYNVSDVVNLAELFEDKTYKSNFTLKRSLLKTYPDLVYKEISGTYKPDVRPEAVRNDRLFIDSSSAQLTTKALCPYNHLSDYDTVSFMYPSEQKAKQFNIPRVNVLEETRKFFYANFPQENLRRQFDVIYNYYKSIEGKNFNASNNYLIDHNVDIDTLNPELQLPPELRPLRISDIEAPPVTCLPYFKKDGSISSCFVNFSVGGIHGAEMNLDIYNYDIEDYKKKYDEYQTNEQLLEKVKQIYPNPCDLKAAKGVTIDGVKYTPSKFLQPKATKTVAFYKDHLGKPPKEPVLFETKKKTKDGVETYTSALADRYAYTSAALCNHEDFTSYYPNLLRMMDAFYNEGLGYDRYGEIFDNKTEYGKLMKDKTLTEIMRNMYAEMRGGTKLLLNSASGAADANFESNIRMNNKIISMRIIGQLFTYRIGQAQTLESASMISTNTDGLYSVLEAEYNNKILARESESIHVEIEPELTYLISKDTNNRMEIAIKDNQLGEIIDARGGDLGCREGPQLSKSLSHPAIIDWALAEYLSIASIGYKDLSLKKPFDDNIGMSIIKSAREKFKDDVHTLKMFQNIIASSPSSMRFTFGIRTNDPDKTPIPLQHYNRCFITKDTVEDTYFLQSAVAKVITDTTKNKRAKNNERPQMHDPIAASILASNGIKTASLPINKEASVVKITNVEDSWHILILNRNLYTMPQADIDELFDNLDYDKYLSLLHKTFENNWRNMSVEYLAPIGNPDGYTPFSNEEIAKAEENIPADSANDINNVAPVADTKVNATDENIITDNKDKNTENISSEIDYEIPKMIRLNKTLLSSTDISNGEHQLCMNGIREIDAHNVLKKLMSVMTDTDIDN